MNERFVNIKVDREERPDLDQIYQTAHALLTRRTGGWPLTMFLTPDRRAVLRRDLLPEGRRATACPDFSISCRSIAAAYHEQGGRDRRAERAACAEAMATLEPAARGRRRCRLGRGAGCRASPN